MATIIPIKELKNTSTISSMCHENDGPIYITKNGYGDMVLMSIQSYEDLIQKIKIYESIMISQKQYEDGNVSGAFEHLEKIKSKYDL